MLFKRTWSGVLISALLCLAGPANADAVPDGCQRAVVGETWNSQCLVADNFALVYARNGPTFKIERVDASGIHVSANIDVSPPLGAGAVDYFGGIMTLVVADGFKAVSTVAKASGTATYIYEPRPAGSEPRVEPYDQTRDFSALTGPLETYLPDSGYFWRMTHSMPHFGAYASDGKYYPFEMHFDSMSFSAVVQAVPEPSGWALMGLGLIGVGAAARRQRRQ
jgi:PEP-CTERM motif